MYFETLLSRAYRRHDYCLGWEKEVIVKAPAQAGLDMTISKVVEIHDTEIVAREIQ